VKPGKKRVIKTVRDMLHHQSVISPRQAARMKEGRVESVPEDYKRISSLDDIDRMRKRKQAEELLEQRRFEREHRDY
jgi:hypothetical protein